MKITKLDPMTGNTNTLEIDMTPEQLSRVNAGVETIQTIVPHLNSDDREFLISGITPDSWDKIFPPERTEVTRRSLK